MANLGFEIAWNKIGGIIYRSEVGDKFIFEAIKKKKAILGGEQSGHILSKINNFSGDGILTAIQIAKFCKIKKTSLRSWLVSSFNPFPQRLTNISLNFDIKKLNTANKKFIDEIIEKYSNNSLEDCRIFIRPSGTESLLRILVEASNPNKVNILSKEISAKISNEINKISIYE